MTRRFLTAAASLTLFVAPFARAAEDALPKAATIMDRFVEVTGGKAAYDKHHSEIATVELEFVGKGIRGVLTRYADTSNNAYSNGEIEGIGKLEEGVYNGQSWENSPIMGPRLKTGAENADAVRDAYFNAPLHWRKLYTAATTGLESVEGDDCYKVTLTRLTEGKPEILYFSKKTGLMTRIDRTMVTPMGEVKINATAADYKPFDGLLVPGKLVQNFMGNQLSLTTLDVKSNVDIPPDRFEPPAEIKKLMEK